MNIIWCMLRRESIQGKNCYLWHIQIMFLHAIQQYLRRCFWSLLSKMSCSTKLQMCKCFIPRKTVWKALFTAIEFLHCFASQVINLHFLFCNNLILAFLKIPSMVLCFRLSFSFFATWAAAIRCTGTVWKKLKIFANI